MAEDIISIELGYDLTTALMITERVRHAGYRVELLRMDNAGQAPGLLALQEHRLLLRQADAADVSAIVDSR